MDWTLLQLADSAFPTGAFVHSQGLEAASALGVAPELETFFAQAMWQTGYGTFPFVRAGAIAEMPIFSLCDEADAFLLNPVQNRASRALGRNLMRTAREAFADFDSVTKLSSEIESVVPHHAPLFGALARALAIAPRDAARIFLHGNARNVLSAAVRLGRVGPLEAQRLLAQAAPLLDDVLAACESLSIEEAAQTSPVSDIASALHDHLYTRLFQS